MGTTLHKNTSYLSTSFRHLSAYISRKNIQASQVVGSANVGYDIPTCAYGVYCVVEQTRIQGMARDAKGIKLERDHNDAEAHDNKNSKVKRKGTGQ